MPIAQPTYSSPLVRRGRAARALADAPVPATLAGSALWLLSSNLVYAACQWGTIVGLAKLGAPVSIGLLGLALAIATPVVMVTGFGLRAVQATDVVQRYSFAEYLQLRMGANLLAAVVIAGAALFHVLEPAAIAILVPIGVAKIAEATSETCYGLAQRHQRMQFVAISRVARGALGLVALLAVVGFGGTLAYGAWALAAAWTAFLLLVDLPVAGMLEPPFGRVRRDAVVRLARESAPLGGVNGLFAACQSAPRYLLELSHGAIAVGYFTALAAITPALTQLAAAVGNAAAPHLGEQLAGDARHYRRLVVELMLAACALGAVLVGGAALAGRPFLTLAYTADYAAYHLTFVIVVAAAALTVVNEVFYYALIATRRPKAQLGLECLALAVTVAGGLLVIPRFGVPGAATVALAGALARTVPAGVLVLRRRS
jgi:O-antigen/teichoic acid export membrane protein